MINRKLFSFLFSFSFLIPVQNIFGAEKNEKLKKSKEMLELLKKQGIDLTEDDVIGYGVNGIVFHKKGDNCAYKIGYFQGGSDYQLVVSRFVKNHQNKIPHLCQVLDTYTLADSRFDNEEYYWKLSDDMHSVYEIPDKAYKLHPFKKGKQPEILTLTDEQKKIKCKRNESEKNKIKEKKDTVFIHYSKLPLQKDTWPYDVAVKLEYIDGETLDSYIKRRWKENNPCKISEILKFMIQIVESLNGFRRFGWRFVDVHGANVMIRNKNKEAVLVDFGKAYPHGLLRFKYGSSVKQVPTYGCYMMSQTRYKNTDYSQVLQYLMGICGLSLSDEYLSGFGIKCPDFFVKEIQRIDRENNKYNLDEKKIINELETLKTRCENQGF